MDLEVLRRWRFADTQRSYAAHDTMLYALGIGLGHDPLDPRALAFVTEIGLQTLPTMAAVVTKLEIRACLIAAGVDVIEAYHGEQRSVFHRPFPPAGRLIGRGRVGGIWDKGAGRGCLIAFEQDIFDADTEDCLCTLRTITFARRDGGHGGDATTPPRLQAAPTEPAEQIFDFPTMPQAALIYRLSGDFNPLHFDPEVARQAGFPRPILHGYCTYGIAGWAIASTYLDGNPERLASLDCRFSAAVFPGETLRTEMWRLGDAIRFRVRVLERDVVAIDQGTATLA